MTIQEAAKQTWAMMDACNTTGILYDLQPIVDAVCEDMRVGSRFGWSTADRNQHPIFICIIDKLAQLAGLAISDDFDLKVHNAYADVRKLAEGE